MGRSWDGVRFGCGVITVLVVVVVDEVEVCLDGRTYIDFRVGSMSACSSQTVS